MDNKIILFLLGKKGLVALRDLLEADTSASDAILEVVIGTDKAVVDDHSNDIQAVCDSFGIKYTVGNKVSASGYGKCYGIAIGWRWLINIEQLTLIVFHDSLLPKYRGFNPLVTALIAGDETVGVTALLAEESFDTGDIIAQQAMSVSYPIKIAQAIDEVAKLYGKLMVEVFGKIKHSNLSALKQDHSLASYSLWRNEEDYLIDWDQTAAHISRFVDSVGYPYLGACTNYDGKPIRVNEVIPIADLNIANRVAGKILMIENNMPVVVCGSGLLQITEAVYDETKEPVKFSKLRVKLQ